MPRDGTWMRPSAVTAEDGYALAVQTFGDAQAARAAVLIASAMGVEQTYYASFAQWLSERGYFVVTFDYRGIGQSRRGPLRALRCDVLTWAEQDAAAVLAFAGQAVAGRPVLWIGHSLGGQILGLVPGYERIRAMLTVAAGSGWWRDYAPRTRWIAPLLWYGIVPVGLAIAGYFPGRRLGVIGDLPAGVMRQWRTWCLDRDYLVGALGQTVRSRYASLKLPILSLSFADDEYMSQQNIEALHAFYAGARCELRRITAAEIGVPAIGHFGFFRRRVEHSLWPQAADWLEQQTTTLH